MTRGRPRKREHAHAAALAIAAGRYENGEIRKAALDFFHLHLGRSGPAFTEVADSERENVRKFVEYVEEELSKVPLGIRRHFKFVEERTMNRRAQRPSSVQKLKRMIADIDGPTDH